jgi:DNA-binding beta-propeller fold protein YncE
VALGVILALPALAAGESEPQAPDAYVTNLWTDNVSQYDVEADGTLTPKRPATVDAFSKPLGVAVHPDGGSVYVANFDPLDFVSGKVSQYTVGGNGVLNPKSPATVVSGVSPSGVAVHPDGLSVYVTNISSHTISQYDVVAGGKLTPKSPPSVAAGPVPVGLTPREVAVHPDGMSLYVTNEGVSTVSQFDVDAAGKLTPKSPPTVAAGSAPGGGPFGLAVSPDGDFAAVANGGGTMSFYPIDAAGKLGPQNEVTVPGATSFWSPLPTGVAISPDGEDGYFTNRLTNVVRRFTIVNPTTITCCPVVAATDIATFGFPRGLAVHPNGNNLYVANSGPLPTGTVSQYAVGGGGGLAELSPATAPAGFAPQAIALGPEQSGPTLSLPSVGSLHANNLRLKVNCALACTVKITGKATVPKGASNNRAASAKTKKYPLKKKTVSLNAGKTKTIRVKFKNNKKSVKKIKALLKGSKKARKGAKLRPKVKGTGPGSGSATKKKGIKLKR